MAKIQINQQQTSIGIGEGMLSYPSQGTPGPSGKSLLIGHAAEGLATIGSATMKYAEQQQERKNTSETTKAQVNFLTQLDSLNTNYLSNTQFTDFESYTNTAKQQFDDLLNTTAQGVTNSRVKEDFINRMRLGKEAQYMSGIAENGRKLNENSFKESVTQDINGLNALLQNPNSLTSYEEASSGLNEIIERYAKSHNIQDQELVDVYKKKETLGLILSHAQGQIEKDPVAFKAKLLGNYSSFIEGIHNADYVSLDTKLTKDEEVKFQEWKKKYAPNDSGYDYDLRGAFKAGLTPDTETGHWDDEFKKPNHSTFSDQSKFAKDEKYAKYAGTWDGEKYSLNPEVLQEFFASEYAPAFTKELSGEVRQKLLDQADTKILKLKTEAEKVAKEHLLVIEDTFNRNNEVHLLGLETEGKSDYSVSYIPKVLNTPEYFMEESFRTIENIAIETGVDRNLFLALLQAESGASHINKKTGKVITSPVGAIGIGQLMPATAKALGVDPNDEKQNLLGAAKYLQQQLKTFNGNFELAAAAYNAGPNAVKKYKGIPPYKETQNYVKRIKDTYKANIEKYGRAPIATSKMQEDIYSITLAKEGPGKAIIALRDQQEKERKASLIHNIVSQINPLLSENDLINFERQTVEYIKNLPTGPNKLLLLEKQSILTQKVNEKLTELKTDPAAYADKYSKTVAAATKENKFTQRAKFQQSIGILDGAVKVLTKQEEKYYLDNITKQNSVEARISSIRDLQKQVGQDNYKTAIAQLANKNSAINKAYWLLPQLDKVNPSVSQDLTIALKDWTNTKLVAELTAKNIDKDLLAVEISKQVSSLIGPNMQRADAKAAQMFSETAQYLGKYYAVTLNTTDKVKIAQQVKKALIEDSYEIIDIGPGNAEDILISKQEKFNTRNLKQFLEAYLNTPLTKNELALSEDFITMELGIGKESFKKSQEYYTNDFINRVNKNLDLLPTISGTGVYLVYNNPTTYQKQLLKNKQGKPIYIDFKKVSPYATQLEQTRTTRSGLIGDFGKYSRDLINEVRTK